MLLEEKTKTFYIYSLVYTYLKNYNEYIHLMSTLKNGILVVVISILFIGCKNKTESINSQTESIELKEQTEFLSLPQDSIIFHKKLVLQNISFEISATGMGSLQNLSIQTYGLEGNDQKIDIEIDGTIVNAEIEDLNSDGYPELLIYTVSAGSGSYGDIIGYSVNNGKSISSIYFPEVSENPKVNIGYMGHDSFAIVATNLVQRFQLYNEGDSNAQPTGNIRQIQYKLVDGEASRKFVVDRVLEYPKN